MERVTLVTVHNAFDRTGRDTRTLDAGLSLEEIRTRHLPERVEFALSINGAVCNDLAVVPRAGDLVAAVPVVQGGNDGKMIGRLIAMVVLTIVATVAQQYWANTLIWGMNAGYLAAGAIMIVGGLLINMAFQASANNLPTLGNDTNSSPSYGWSPQSTQQQGIVVPKWYGKNRLYGNIIVAHILYSGKESYINALINMGFGPFQSLSDFKINDQPAANFSSITIDSTKIRLGELDQTVIPDFNETAIEYSTSQLAQYGVPALYTTQSDSFDRLDVLVQFARGLGNYNDQGTLTALSCLVRISIRKQGDVDWTVITREPYQYSTSPSGYWSAGRWVNYPDYYGETAFIPAHTEWEQVYIGSSNAPDHLEGDSYGSGDLIWHWIGEPIVLATGIRDYITVTGAQSTTLRLNFSQAITSQGYYDIKVERLTADFTSQRELGELYLASVKEITMQTFTYPRQVLVGLKALATNQLSGSLRFSCLAECSLVRIWDGSAWTVAYSTNPAWVCYDVLTQPVFDNAQAVLRYDGIDPSRIDHVKFKEWADYCDELLPDGNGGTEKRVEFNGGFDSEMTLWEAVLRICSVSYAVTVWNGINLSVSIDKPADPVQLFSLGNIEQDSFKESFLPMEDRAAEIEVDFVNEENNYQRDKLTVINTAIDTVNSKVSMSLFGITKPSMAWRAAMRKLAYNQHISRTIEFGADIDAIACTVGDVILVQHDVPQWGYGGRIVAATTTEITIDQTITLAADTQYAILVRLEDDSLVERDITNTPGDASVLTVSPAFATAPQQFDVYSVGEILKTAKPFRVTDIARDGELKAKISAVEYVAGIYDVDYGLPATGGLNYSQPLSNYKQALPPFEKIISASVNESLRKSASGLVSVIATIQWTPPVNRYAFPAADIWAWQDNTPAAKIASGITSDNFEWIVSVDGVWWNFAVASVNLNGESQRLADCVPARKFIFGKTVPPADVTDFSAAPVITGGLRLAWSHVADLDLLEYVIKYSPLETGASWYGASELTRTSANYTNINAALTGTYFIKAVDTTGNESAAADSLVVSTAPIQVNATPYAVITEHPAWSGTKTSFNLASGEISVTGSDAVGNTGIYTAVTEVDFGSVKTARVSAKCEWLATPAGDWDSIADIDNMASIDTATGKSGLQVYITTSQDSSAPSYKQPLFAGDYTFQRAVFSIEAYEQQPDQLTVTGLTINVDIHDIVVTI